MRVSTNRKALLQLRAAEMRKAPTASEERLFEALRGRRLGVAFRRQVPLAGRFIADLYAAEIKLVVEVDGGYHGDRRRADARRERALAEIGVHVLRVEASLVMGDLGAAVACVQAGVDRLRRATVV